MQLVLIESPFAPSLERAQAAVKASSVRLSLETALIVDGTRNIEYLKACMREACTRGEAPFASHLLYTQFLDDTIPDERKLGINCGLAWGLHAEKTIVYVDRGISNGMRYGIDNARKAGRPVEFRMLGKGITLEFSEVA